MSLRKKRKKRRMFQSTCPICGFSCGLKTMPLHLSFHKPNDPDVVAWRERQ